VRTLHVGIVKERRGGRGEGEGGDTYAGGGRGFGVRIEKVGEGL